MKARKKKEKTKIDKPCAAEVDIAFKLLQDWGYISHVMDFNKWFLRPTIENFSNLKYKYGKDLFEHLNKISRMKNIWVPDEVVDPVRALSCVLERTSYRKMLSGSEAISNKIVALKKQHLDTVGEEYDDSQDESEMDIINNLEKAIASKFVLKKLNHE
jgi:hypothetical protein